MPQWDVVSTTQERHILISFVRDHQRPTPYQDRRVVFIMRFDIYRIHWNSLHLGWTMMAPSNETFSALLAICEGKSPFTGEFPAQRPVTRSFDIFFDLPLDQRLSKQWRDWWFEAPSRPLWRHCNAETRWESACIASIKNRITKYFSQRKNIREVKIKIAPTEMLA